MHVRIRPDEPPRAGAQRGGAQLQRLVGRILETAHVQAVLVEHMLGIVLQAFYSNDLQLPGIQL